MEILRYKNQSAKQLFGEREETSSAVESAVGRIIADVRENGDKALKAYAEKFDGFNGGSFEVTEIEISKAVQSLSSDYIKMLETSVFNIEKFHKKQLRKGFEIDDGNRIVGQKITPLERAGIYVPGGTAAYPSTVLMNAVPAKIAGVKEIVMTTPAKADGKIRAEVLAAAKICGVDRIFKAGGAQAIAALAYGTESIPKVDKITGPGNVYVAAAKRLVSGVCGIDMIAGPSEILIVADKGANPAVVAADLLSQAEHDVNASAVLLTDSKELAEKVVTELEIQVGKLPRKEIAQTSHDNNCKIILTDSIDCAIELSDKYAPEHLELCVGNAFEYLEKVKNAGSVFLGYNTPEAAGDYYAGPNHTLPTGGTARFSSPLGVDDFVKSTQYIYYTKSALESAAVDIIKFAVSEGLDAHAESVIARLDR